MLEAVGEEGMFGRCVMKKFEQDQKQEESMAEQ